MGYFTQPALTIVLNPDDDAPAHNTVTVRKWTGEERARVTSLAMAPVNVLASQQALLDGGRPEILIDISRLRIETVKVCVTAWNGPDFEGRPVTPANIAQLPPDVLDQIADACDKVNQGLTDDEKKTSAAPMSTPL